MRAGNPIQMSSALKCTSLLWVVAHSCFSSQNPLCATQKCNWWSLFVGWVSAQKRELLLWEVKTCKIHPLLKTKSMTNQSDTYIKLKSWRTITECSACSTYRILTRKVSLCVGCNLGRIFLWQVNHAKARLLAHFLVLLQSLMYIC